MPSVSKEILIPKDVSGHPNKLRDFLVRHGVNIDEQLPKRESNFMELLHKQVQKEFEAIDDNEL